MVRSSSGGNNNNNIININQKKREEMVAVAIDKDKGSHYALKWAIDRLVNRGQTLTLIHVKHRTASSPSPSSPSPHSSSTANSENSMDEHSHKQQLDHHAREFFLPFRCFCTRKDIESNEVILEDVDIPKALINYVSSNFIDILVLGAPSRSGIVRRFKSTDVPSSVSKGAPDFCTVYIISKGKVSSVRHSTASPPVKSVLSPSSTNLPPRNQLQLQTSNSPANFPSSRNQLNHHPPAANVSDKAAADSKQLRGAFLRNIENITPPPRTIPDDIEIKSPFTRPGTRVSMNKGSDLSLLADSDISFVCRGKPSTERYSPARNSAESTRISNFSDMDNTFSASSSSASNGNKSTDNSTPSGYSTSSHESENTSSWSAHNGHDDLEAEMRRLKLELKQTMDMYSAACKEALLAKQKAKELHRWKLEEENRLEEARMAEELALAQAEKEKEKCKAAMRAAEAAKRIADFEAKEREKAERAARIEKEKDELLGIGKEVIKYRRYTVEEIQIATENFSDALKIGEGGYGPVYRGTLDHTPVAIKVLRPDAAHGRSQFQQEIEVLSCIRHPNMVLLLGACPEYGCLVYEYMGNGSLEDCLFNKGDGPVLSWQLRFRIAAEIATGLLFLHQTKPEPIVHRDLKPGNILLDHNFVSKISDVGLARLVPPSIANSVTQYRMTTTAGTFCYIDPEYQQTGQLGIKSDIYSLGVMLLQIITSKPPIGLAHAVERSIRKGTFAEMLDPEVPDWPVEEALTFAKLSIQCAEMRKRDRPDLGKVVLPELNRLRVLADESMGVRSFTSFSEISSSCPGSSQASSCQEIISPPQLQDGSWSDQSSNSQSGSVSSFSEKNHLP